MRIVLAVLLALIFVPTWNGTPRLPLLGTHAIVHARPVELLAGDPGMTRIGDLEWLGGVALTSPDRAFGGFSSMTVEGDRFTLLSDGGNVVRFRMGDDWHVRAPQFANLPAGPGAGWDKSDRDSESMTRDPATGTRWVGFENSNEIWRYDDDFARATGRVAPPAMRDWRENGGAESLLRLADGSFVTVSETAHWPRTPRRIAVHFDRDPVAAPRQGYRFGIMPSRSYSPSDLAALPDGRWIMLERQFDLPYAFTARLVLIDPRQAGPGAALEGREIARFAPPLIHDNFEALAATREGDDTIIWIASDDNQSILQRSLLLKFRLVEPARQGAGDRAITPAR